MKVPPRSSFSGSEGVRAAENVVDLVGDHLLDLSAGHGQIDSRVEGVGLLVEHAADTGGHGEADVGVDIDLADREGGGFSQLLLRDADRVRKLSAEGVDFLDVFLRNGGRAVENDREAGQSLRNLFEDAMEGRPSRSFKQFMAVTLKLSHIVDPNYFYHLVDEGVAKKIIKKLPHPETKETYVVLQQETLFNGTESNEDVPF